LSLDGKKLFVVNSGSSVVSIINTYIHMTTSIVVGSYPNYCVLNPDGSQLYVATDGGQGYQGYTGAGTQGPQGYQGYAGAGTQGSQGYQGYTGAGTQGPQGYQGYSGAGTQGPQSYQGVPGYPGGTLLTVQYADNTQLDTFGRVRVSDTTVIFNSNFRYDMQ
jgi:YVTN family beta-propeller protein